MKFYQNYIKKLFDTIGALCLIVMASPVFILIWLIVKATMGSPAIISQKRVGFHGKIFNLYKFRTMSLDKDSNGQLLPDEDRITKVGAFLRKTSLDEILQFFNVLKGDMSFIGPRPFMESEISVCDENSFHRHDVLPGLSGLAQVSGRNEINVLDKIKKDLIYVNNISFALDVKIFFLTIINVILCKDANPINKNTVAANLKDKQ